MRTVNKNAKSFSIDSSTYEEIKSYADSKDLKISKVVNDILNEMIEDGKIKEVGNSNKKITKSFTLDIKTLETIIKYSKKKNMKVSNLLNNMLNEAIKDGLE